MREVNVTVTGDFCQTNEGILPKNGGLSWLSLAVSDSSLKS